MKIRKLEIEGVLEISPTRHDDERGFFLGNVEPQIAGGCQSRCRFCAG